MKIRIKLILTVIALTAFPLVSALYADSTAKTLEITVSIRDGSNDNPMMVLWLENNDGDFIKTLHMFSKRKTHYENLKGWASKSKEIEKPDDIDAVSGATVGWNQTGTVSIPAQIGAIDLLSGKYVLRLESRTHFGENYRSLTIPLPEDYTGSAYEDIGCMKSVDVKVKTN
ncbi:MAG: DUF2271 domain-containing protein [Kiritimatiellales bacterium]